MTRIAQTNHTRTGLRLVSLLLVLLLGVGLAQAQTSSFTYQGRLTDGGSPATNAYDLQFKLFDALSGGTQIGTTVSTPSVQVAGGIFTVTLDFGAGAFSGANRWLEINARLAGSGAFNTLTPRQPVTSTPYATKSLNASTATTADGLSAACVGCVTDAQIASISGSKVIGAVANATNAVNATTAVSFSSALGGDVTGTQGATTVTKLQNRPVANTQPLGEQVLKFNSTTNQWEPGTDNVGVGGGAVTSVTASAPLASSGGTAPNISLNGPLPVANGGTGSTTQNYVDLTNAQTVSGAKTFSNTIAGSISGNAGTVTNGVYTNSSYADPAFITSLAGSKITGTVANATTAVNFSGALAGDVTGTQTNTQLANGSVTNAKIADVAGSKITGTIPVPGVPAGSSHYIQNSTTQQASSNFNISGNGTIGGALTASTLSGNGANLTNLNANNISSGVLPIPRGGTGLTSGPTTAGLFLRSVNNGQGGFEWSSQPIQPGDLPGGSDQYIRSTQTPQPANFSITGFGQIGFDLTVGRDLSAGRQLAVDTGASFNGDFTALGGLRFGNTGTLSGEGIASKRTGGGNQYGLDFYTGYTSRMAITNAGNVGIGTDAPGAALHISSGGGLIFPQLLLNKIGNANDGSWLSFAGNGSNSWTLAAFPDQLTIKSRNGGDVDIMDLRRTGPNTITTSTGARLTSGGVWTNNSDRNRKHQFAAVNAREILAQVVKLPIQFWSYKAEDEKIRHIGPMAQDFAAAFHLGGSDNSIGTVDADGVALAAIQGLHQLVEEKHAQAEQLQQQVQALQAQNRQLQQQVQQLRETEIKQQQRELESLKKLVCPTHPNADVCHPAKAENK